MTRMLIGIDEEALAKAQEAFGAKTKKDTVNRVLVEVTERLDRAAAWRELQRLAVEDGALDLDLLADKSAYRPSLGAAPSSEAGQDAARSTSRTSLLNRDNDFQTIAKRSRQPTEMIQR